MNKRVVLAALETAYGVDSSPTAADAILLSKLTLSPLEGESVQRDFIKPYFGSSGEIRVSNFAKLEFEVELAGSGTPGIAPPWGKLLQACGFDERLISTDVIDVSPSAGTSNTIVLSAADSAIDNFYTGCTIELTAGTGVGQKREIINYDGSTKTATVSVPWATTPDSTSGYTIRAAARYVPISNFNTNSSLSLYFNVDGVRHILLGARGTFSIDLSAKALPVFKFVFTGLLGTISDSALPSATFGQWQTPDTVSTANTTDINLQGYNSAVVQTLKFDIAASVVYRQLVGAESVVITGRKPTGSVSIEAVTVAEKDWWTSAKNAQTGEFGVKHGQTAGNSIALISNTMQLTSPKYADSDNVAMMEFGMQFIPTIGNDEFFIVSK